MLTQASENEAVSKAEPPPRRTCRGQPEEAAAASKAEKATKAAKVRPSDMFSASQPTLRRFGDVWAANCNAASALQARAGDSDQGQAVQAAAKKKAAKAAAKNPRKKRS